MVKKKVCVERIEELIVEGRDVVLVSKGKLQEIINQNKREQIRGEAFYEGYDSYTNIDSYLEANKHRFTKTYITIDHNLSYQWTLEVHSCLVSFLGKEHDRTKDIEIFTKNHKVEKNHVERIISILEATKSAIEKGDIKIMQKDTEKETIQVEKPNNVINITAHPQSQINIANNNSTVNANQNNGVNFEQLKSLIADIRQNIPSDIKDEDSKTLNDSLEIIELELSKPEPKESLVRTALNALNSVKEGVKEAVKFLAALTTLYKFVAPFAGLPTP
jgi:hypothetical protein